MIIHEDLKELFRLLNEHTVEYVVVGGYAVAFYGFIRATKDIDILFRNTPQNNLSLTKALESFGIAPEMMDSNTFSEPGRIIRIGSPPVMVELINGIGGVDFNAVWETRVMGKYGNVPVPFISRHNLILSKKTAGRPQDIRDIEELDGNPA